MTNYNMNDILILKTGLKYFEIINIRTSMSNTIFPFCTSQEDRVWCRHGDLCKDTMCSPLCPGANCAHDGCCTGWWDCGGDTRGCTTPGDMWPELIGDSSVGVSYVHI